MCEQVVYEQVVCEQVVCEQVVCVYNTRIDVFFFFFLPSSPFPIIIMQGGRAL